MKTYTLLFVMAIYGCSSSTQKEENPDTSPQTDVVIKATLPRLYMSGSSDPTHIPDPSGGPPSSCKDIQNEDPDYADGPFTIYLHKDLAKPWEVFCVGLDTDTPKEYLYVSTGTYSKYRKSDTSFVLTTYYYLRINPETLMVDIDDQTQAVSQGSVQECGTNIVFTSVPAGVAASCSGSHGEALAKSVIDLKATPFSIAPGAFSLGATSAGSATYSNNNKTVVLLGGGSPGWVGVKGIVKPIVGAHPGLQLVYGTEQVNGSMVCSGTTVDTQMDNANCGSCGNSCDSAHTCSAGFCKLVYGETCYYNEECSSGNCKHTVTNDFCYN